MGRALAVALFALAAHCPGQVSMELSASASTMLFGGNPIGYQGYTDYENKVPGNDVSLGRAGAIGGRLTMNTGPWIAHELGYSHGWHSLAMEWNDMFTLKQRRALWTVFYDLLACAMPEDAPFRLCGAAGPHLARYDARESLQVLGRQTDQKAGINFGAVAKFRVGYHFVVRLDAREYMNPKPFELVEQHGWLRQHELSGGFGLRF